MTWTDGAAIHPRFLRVGPWVLSLVAAMLFVLSFATSYAALDDYALQLQFGREFAIVFPLVLDAVISVLAVTVLLERALRRRTLGVKGWQFAVRLPTWPLLTLWILCRPRHKIHYADVVVMPTFPRTGWSAGVSGLGLSA